MNKENLIRIGGKHWEKGSQSRVYFGMDIIMAAIGLKCTYYKSGNIQSARLNGSKISNGKAVKMRMKLSNSKFYYDCNTKEFASGMDAATHKQVADYITGLIK